VRIPIVLLVVLALSTARRARAEDIASYEIEGEADAGGSDPRVAALDEAFAGAVAAALQDLVDDAGRKANKRALDKEIVGRARLWVAKFAVTKDETRDGRRQLTVAVRVDRDKMRARLAELNIAATPVGEPARPGGKTAVVLLRLVAPHGVRASYGASAEPEPPGLAALASLLRGAGMQTRRAPASGPAVKAGGELPIADDEADALAAEAKADVAAIAGVEVGAPVAVRGLAEPGVLVSVHLRVIARGGSVVGQGVVTVAARGREPAVIAAAIDRALVTAAGDALPATTTPLAAGARPPGDDAPVGAAGVVLVRLAPQTPWGFVLKEQKFLAGAKGVQSATLRRLSRGGWVIGVTTGESVQRIAQIARKPPATDTHAQVKIVGDIVEVTLTGAP
jgi:hypothetical protein